MRTWTLETPLGDVGRVGAVLGNVVAAIGMPSFGETLLEGLNTVLPVGCWSAYEIGTRHPRMYLSGSYRRRDTTLGSWNAYLSGPHLSDRSFLLGDATFLKPSVCHVTAEEIPSKAHRDKVYKQFDMIERLSVAEQSDPQGSVFAINLYRYAGQTHFSDRDILLFEMLAQPLLAAVRRHLALYANKSSLTCSPVSVEHLRETLKTRHPDLPDRELDVCARVMMGMTYDGIAADLGLKVPTVKTYRNRAFERLGIRFRSELTRHYLEASVNPEPPDTQPFLTALQSSVCAYAK